MVLHVVLIVEADHAQVHHVFVELAEEFVGVVHGIVLLKFHLVVVQELSLLTCHRVLGITCVC